MVAQQIDDASQIDWSWLSGVGVIGLTAGASAPEVLVDEVIQALQTRYDLVILDSPALLVNSDSVMLSDLADGAILVVRAGVTPAPAVARAIEQIDESKLRGVVLNGSNSAIPGWLRRLSGM